MHPEEWITDIDNQIKFLESLSEQDINDWIKDGLKGKSWPIWKDTERDFHEHLIYIYKAASNKLQRHIERAIARLIHSWKKSDNKEYLYYLIYLCGRLRITDEYKRILSWVHEGKFKNEFAFEDDMLRTEDLHLHCLMAIGSQVPLDDKLMQISCVRDIEIDANPYYFNICYRILYTSYTDYQEYLIKYFHKFVELCYKKVISFIPSFYYIYKHENCRIAFLENLETNILTSLSPLLIDFFLRQTLIGGDTDYDTYELMSINENVDNIYSMRNYWAKRTKLNYIAKLNDFESFMRELGYYLAEVIDTKELANNVLQRKTSLEALIESDLRVRD